MTSFTPPTTGVSDAPVVTLSINQEWVSFIMGALEALQSRPEYAHSRQGIYATLQEPIWVGDDQTQYDAEQKIEMILNALGKGL